MPTIKDATDSKDLDPTTVSFFPRDSNGVGATLRQLPYVVGEKRVGEARRSVEAFMAKNGQGQAALRIAPKGALSDSDEALSWVPEV
jgi:hypothetical protein